MKKRTKKNLGAVLLTALLLLAFLPVSLAAATDASVPQETTSESTVEIPQDDLSPEETPAAAEEAAAINAIDASNKGAVIFAAAAAGILLVTVVTAVILKKRK